MSLGDTCSSLTQELRPLYDKYGEEQILCSLRDLLQLERIEEEDEESAECIQGRILDLEKVIDKW